MPLPAEILQHFDSQYAAEAFVAISVRRYKCLLAETGGDLTSKYHCRFYRWNPIGRATELDYCGPPNLVIKYKAKTMVLVRGSTVLVWGSSPFPNVADSQYVQLNDENSLMDYLAFAQTCYPRFVQ
jgi:hypothetical protein